MDTGGQGKGCLSGSVLWQFAGEGYVPGWKVTGGHGELTVLPGLSLAGPSR